MNLKKFSLAICSLILSTQVLVSCQSDVNLLINETELSNQVKAQSSSGVFEEIEVGALEAFYMLDEDENGVITEKEFGKDSSKNIVNFKDVDKNKNGKVTVFELMPDEFKKFSLMGDFKDHADKIFFEVDSNGNRLIDPKEILTIMVDFDDYFADYDEEDPNPGNLTKSEFQNLFAFIAMKNYPQKLEDSTIKTAKLELATIKGKTKMKKKSPAAKAKRLLALKALLLKQTT